MFRKLEEIYHYDKKGQNYIFLTTDLLSPQANSLRAQKSGKSHFQIFIKF